MKKVVTDRKIYEIINISMVDQATPIYIACDGVFIGMIVEVGGGWRASGPIEWLSMETFKSCKDLINEYSSYDYFVME